MNQISKSCKNTSICKVNIKCKLGFLVLNIYFTEYLKGSSNIIVKDFLIYFVI